MSTPISFGPHRGVSPQIAGFTMSYASESASAACWNLFTASLSPPSRAPRLRARRRVREGGARVEEEARALPLEVALLRPRLPRLAPPELEAEHEAALVEAGLQPRELVFLAHVPRRVLRREVGERLDPLELRPRLVHLARERSAGGGTGRGWKRCWRCSVSARPRSQLFGTFSGRWVTRAICHTC